MTLQSTARIMEDGQLRPSKAVIDLAQQLVQLGKQNPEAQEKLFARLDEILEVIESDEVKAVLEDRDFQTIKNSLHNIRALYEYDREVLLAQNIVAKRNAGIAQDFRSHDWYDKALDFETNALKPYHLKRILFVGSGPFPTSPMAFLRNNPQAQVSCMERSAPACDLARKVSAIFDLPDLEIINVDGAEVTDFRAYDCVIVGLVVGSNNQTKQSIVDHFLKHVPEKTLLCFRSADGPGRVIYPNVDLAALKPYSVEVLEGPPHKSFTMVIVKR